jgi:hypothetical protein
VTPEAAKAAGRSLRLATHLSFPLELVTESVGILAKRRAGKSTTARRLAEQLHHARQQVVIADPKGDWWGLRFARDGKAPGLPFIVLGGEHGDVPLEVGAGELVAKLVVTERVSVVLDLSKFRKGEVATFMTAFMETLYRLKAQEQFRTPMMLIIDEADAIAPQKPMRGEERMLGAAEDLVRRGGQRGIGVTMITQRSAVLNKNVLTQIGILVVLRTIAPQDLAAMDAWIDVHGTVEQRRQLMASLPSLPTGEGWVWAPGWPDAAGIFQRSAFLLPETFDSSATPKAGEKRVQPKNPADVDLEAFRREMTATIERAKQADPKELRKEVASLRAQLTVAQRKLQTPAAAGVTRAEKRVDVPVLKDGQLARLEKVVDRLGQFGERTVRLGQDVVTVSREITTALAKLHTPANGHARPVSPRAPAAPTRAAPPRAAPPRPPAAEAGEFRPSAAQQRILNGLAWLEAIGVAAGDRAQVALLARAKPTGGYYNNQVSQLRTQGLLDYPREGTLALTDVGRPFAVLEHVPQTSHELQQQVFGMVSGLQRRILEHLVRAYPASIDREDLAAAVGADAGGGYFNNQVSALRTLGVLDYPAKGQVVASSVLFLEGR